MPLGKRVGPSEMERTGPKRSGVFGIARAFEKLRVIYSTEQDENAANLDAKPDKWRHGGLESTRQKLG